MYADTPRSYVGNVWERHLYGDQPLGWDIIGTEDTVRGATRDTFLSYIDRWYRPERLVVGVGGKLGDGLAERLEELLGSIASAETGTAAESRPARERERRPRPYEGLRPGARRRRGTELPTRAPRPVRGAASLDGARRRDVLTALHRGPRAARSRLLRVLREQLVRRRRRARRTGRRRPEQDRRGDRDDRRRAAPRRRRARPGGRAREGAIVHEGPIRARAGEPARDDHVRPPSRASRGSRRSSPRRCSRASTPSPRRTSSASRRTSSARTCASPSSGRSTTRPGSSRCSLPGARPSQWTWLDEPSCAAPRGRRGSAERDLPAVGGQRGTAGQRASAAGVPEAVPSAPTTAIRAPLVVLSLPACSQPRTSSRGAFNTRSTDGQRGSWLSYGRSLRTRRMRLGGRAGRRSPPLFVKRLWHRRPRLLLQAEHREVEAARGDRVHRAADPLGDVLPHGRVTEDDERRGYVSGHDRAWRMP